MIGHVPSIICQDRIIKLFKEESYTAYWANSTDQLELQDRVGPLPPMISVGVGVQSHQKIQSQSFGYRLFRSLKTQGRISSKKLRTGKFGLGLGLTKIFQSKFGMKSIEN